MHTGVAEQTEPVSGDEKSDTIKALARPGHNRIYWSVAQHTAELTENGGLKDDILTQVAVNLTRHPK